MDDFEREPDRELGPEMLAERWYVIGGDSIMWMHPPSHRCVTVEGPIARMTPNGSTCMAVPALYGEPENPQTEGYIVACRKHDENGNPYEGHAFWVLTYGDALRRARLIRTAIIEERPSPAPAQQMTLDELLERGAKG